MDASTLAKQLEKSGVAIFVADLAAELRALDASLAAALEEARKQHPELRESDLRSAKERVTAPLTRELVRAFAGDSAVRSIRLRGLGRRILYRVMPQ